MEIEEPCFAAPSPNLASELADVRMIESSSQDMTVASQPARDTSLHSAVIRERSNHSLRPTKKIVQMIYGRHHGANKIQYCTTSTTTTLGCASNATIDPIH
jgi:hypothetical protein